MKDTTDQTQKLIEQIQNLTDMSTGDILSMADEIVNEGRQPDVQRALESILIQLLEVM